MRGWYYRFTARELKGRRVRAIRPMRSGLGVVPAGATGTITGKHSDVSVDFDACSHCGVQMYMSKIGADGLELLPAAEGKETGDGK